MPFVRLLAIYAIVILAAIAWFNRDSISALFASPEVETTATIEEPPASEQQATPLPPLTDLESGWASARNAYWDGDTRTAEALYRRLTEAYPFEADLWGELGNLYYSSGRTLLAGDSYLTAGRVALQAGNAEQAKVIVEVLQGFAPTKAAELQSLVDVIAVDTTQ